MTYNTAEGETVTVNTTVMDGAISSTSSRYSVFIYGDNPYTEITNANITDGSSCIVVKESFGNAFTPYLIDHYQTVYVIDYRYWTGSVSNFAREKNVNAVLFVNSVSMVRNSYLIGKLAAIQ